MNDQQFYLCFSEMDANTDQLLNCMKNVISIDKIVRDDHRYHQQLVNAVDEVVNKMRLRSVSNELTNYVKQENCYLLEFLTIVGIYSKSPDELFKPLSEAFESFNFCVQWSAVHEKRGQLEEALQILHQRKPSNLIECELMKVHCSRIESSMNDDIDRKPSSTLNNSIQTKLSQLISELVVILINTISQDDTIDLISNDSDTEFEDMESEPLPVRTRVEVHSPRSDTDQVQSPQPSTSSEFIDLGLTTSRLSPTPSTTSIPSETESQVIIPRRSYGTNPQVLSDAELLLATNFKPYVPQISRGLQSWTLQVKCMVCPAIFGAKRGVYSPEYYRHCIKDCTEYKKLGTNWFSGKNLLISY